MNTIENIRTKDMSFSHVKNIPIIVDSDLDKLPLYNSRELPIIDGYYLSERFSLVYASADGGSEYFPNKLIRICDKQAIKALNQIK